MEIYEHIFETDVICLHTLIAAHAADRPDAVAIRCGAETLSYGELDARANQVARALVRAGVKPDTPVGLCLERSTDLLVGMVGILAAGGAYVPLDPEYPAARLARILDQAAPPVILSRASLADRLPDTAAMRVDIAETSAESSDPPTVTVTPENLCYLIFTSGSTGEPKGVMVTHQNVVRLFSTIARDLPFSANDVWTLYHSCAFGFSAWEIFGALLHGAELVIVPDEDRADPAAMSDLIRRHAVTVLSLTPSAFRQLLLQPGFDAAALPLRTVVLSGEAVAGPDLKRWFAACDDHGPTLINTYAITETGGQVTFRRYSAADATNLNERNIGHPLSDTPVWIMDAELKPLPAGEPGELCVGGPGVARGYIAQPELTLERFVEVDIAGEGHQRIYRTGDQARLLPDGSVEFLGRRDNQVKIRGYRVELGDIESALGRHEAVTACAVEQRTGASGEQRLVAYVVAAEPPPSVSALRAHLENSLPEYMIPATYVFLEALPLNPNGKLDRNALPEPGSERPELAVPYAEPTNELEAAIAEIWAEALGLSRVGIDDDFFELGGDSILALKLTSQLRELLGVYIYISALIEAPTVRALADYLTHEHGLTALPAGGSQATAQPLLPSVTPAPEAAHETFPLTDIQQAYLVGRSHDFAMGGVSTHLYIEVDASDLDLARLEQAWQKVIDRHPMLRAIVLPDGTQRILPDVPAYRFPVQDLRSLDAAGVDQGLNTERERLSHQVIPSDRWPLFELSASLLPNNRTRVHISLDCLITDARSFQIMSEELLTFYRDAGTTLPEPGVSFRDYVITERTLRDSPFYERALAYWRERLETLPPMPQLPLARAPETLDTHRFAQRGRELSTDEWQRFQARASQSGVTPTAALLQCFGETLAAWSRSPRLTLNLTLFNRMPLHPDVDYVVGDFTSLVLVGVDELHEGNFEARVQRLQKELWRGVDNRFVSGVRVLREMAQMGEKVQPMMPIVFTSTLGIGSGGQNSSSWHRLGEQVYSVSQTPQVWIDHVASERDGALWFTWDVVDELFPPGMIDAMFNAYSKRLTELANDDAAWNRDWITTLESMLPDEQRTLREQVNATSAPEPGELLHAGFLRAATRFPDEPAVIATDRTLTYAELDRLSTQLAHKLKGQGVGTNELVAVVMQKGWEQVVAVLGILKAGAAYLPVDAAMPAERLHYLLEFGQARVAVTQVCQDAAIDWPAETVRLIVSDDQLADAPVTPVQHTTQLHDIAYVIFTSGSTGQPKGVVIDHRGAINTCADINQRFNVTERDRVLALSSLSFDLSVYDIFGLLAAGGAVVMPDAAGMRDPSHWATLVARHRVTIWNTVPALMDLLTDYAEQQVEPVLDSLRVVMMSGDWVPVKLPDRIRALGAIDVYSLGGATEASIWSIIYPIGEVPPTWTSIPYGKPMLNQTFHVLNADLTPCPDWVPGELYIGGIGVAKGYWRDKAKTEASFITHPRTGERLYRTGDLGRYLPDGNIEFLGREDFQVKIQGFRVELGDIEAALESHPGVRNAVVIAHGPDRGSKRLVAYLVAHGAEAPDAQALKTWLGGKLPEYMVPTSYVFLERLPLTANGKVDRRELPEPPAVDGERAPKPDGMVSSNADIARIVAGVLGADSLEPSANLLQMGATSIEMIRIANALDQHLQFRPRMDDFYRDPTVDGLSALFGATRPAASATGDVPQGDPLQTPPWLLNGIDKVLDPEARERFKGERPSLRRFAADTPTVPLERGPATAHDYLEHRSHRDFDPTPLPQRSFAELLGYLSSVDLSGKPKFLYASAGGIYPVQTYVYVKPGRIDGLDAGCYYHDPADHALRLIEGDDADLRSVYDPLINRPIFDKAAFAVFLVVDLKAIGALYPDRALHYATLEAGHITQLLEMRAPELGLGLCQIGGLETADLVGPLQLDPHHLVVHGLLGGGLAATAAADPAAPDVDTDERDEGEI